MSASPSLSLSSLEADSVAIVAAESARDVTFYVVQIALGSGEAWKVARRYNRFKDLHDGCGHRAGWVREDGKRVRDARLGWVS